MNSFKELVCKPLKLSSIIFLLPIVFFSSFAQAEPALTPFYQEVSKISPSGKLGQIIKQEKISTPIKGAQAWRIAYISSDVAERPTISTGLVVAPVGAAPKEGRPVLAWAHGTRQEPHKIVGLHKLRIP